MSTAPAHSKVVVTKGTHELAVQQRPTPEPTGRQILIRIEAAGICATDLHLIRKSIPYLQPKVDICGHEGIGRIVQLGPDVDAQWKVGERVAHRWIFRWCGQCEMCKEGNEQLCDRRELSGKDVDGCWAEYTLVDSNYLLRIPEEIDPAAAAPVLCAGTTVYRALKTAALAPGQWVAIVGAGGGLGHLAIQYAKVQGLKVLAIDGGQEKGKMCEKLGADVYVDFTATKDITSDITSATGGGAHGILVTSSSPRAYEQALTYVRKRGIVMCIGITPQKMTFPIGPEYFVARGVRLTGTSTGTMEDTREALEYVRSGLVKPIVIEKSLEDIAGCLDVLEKGDAVGRYVVRL
ncbi:alcohol dehydrogenase [Durotheca rogersii]|uniref:alcohol dehydrogenase n=1 Tax=Durotheca rogersii TaxID=419775 RepID=UPI00221F159C|nr:alcohol dehydrogenase [Durotheca rogersii]KAI5865626.1 alcohol dehydrogenase [Durotheca rogersii]